jgi:hypothetical protein
MQTSYFWMRGPALFSFLMMWILPLGFLGLAMVAVYHLLLWIQARFTNVNPLRQMLAVVAVLALTVLFPKGLVDFSRWEEPDVMTFEFNGTMRQNRLRIKQNNRFAEEESSFLTIREYPGRYVRAGDTLVFFYDEKTSDHPGYAWGILRSKDQDGNPVSFEFYPDWDKKRHYTYLVRR